MADYETLRQAHAASFMASLPAHFARLTWPVEQLRAERETKLRALVAYAQARSPWHRSRLGGVAAERLTEDGLRALPVMTKHDLMEHFDAIVTDPRLTRDVVETHLDGLTTDAYLLDEYHACASGGSSGRRGIFVFDREAWVTTFASLMRFTMPPMQQALGAEPPRMAIVAADKATHMTAALGQTFPPPGGEIRRVPATWPLERIVAALHGWQPNVLVGYASMLHQLTREAEAGRLRIAPKLVSPTSEPLLPEIRSAITTTWGVPIVNGFGSTEGLMGGSCSAGRGIHLSDDLFVIEPVDAAGNPAPPGARAAKVYLTSLFNFTQPLIRYELTDEVTVLAGPCPCGMTLLRIDDIQGRLDDGFAYPGGPTVHPFTFRSILGQEREIVEYQVRQTPRGAEIFVRCQGAVDTQRIAAKIAVALAALGLVEPIVTVASVATLERQATGKLRRFMALPAA
jgi:phenylacetate-coenzyme A ligase PaaK-like adenylate-forming protein